MRKIGSTIALIATAFLASADADSAFASEVATQPAMLEFINVALHVRLRYPANWTQPEKDVPGQVFVVQSPAVSEKDLRFGVVSLRIDRSATSGSDAGILIDLSGGIAGYVFKNGGQKVTILPGELAGTTARRIRFESDQPSGRLRTIYVLAVKHKIAYVFNFAAPVEVYDLLLPDVEAVLKSFEVLE